MSSSFSPSAAELSLVNQIFSQFDPQKLGVLTGDVAVRVFGGAKLSPTLLGEIWSIADEENKGWLSKRGVSIAVRLMGWAQKGEAVTKDLLDKQGPLPTIEGVTPPIVAQSTGVSVPKSPPPGFPLLTVQDRTKFQRLFANYGPMNGLLSGEKARDVFVKSKLPVDKLSQIWNLADTQDRGALDSTDFAIGMYLIQASMSGQLSFIPSTLPPGLYEQAGGKPSGSIATHTTGSSRPISPTMTGSFQYNRAVVQPQYTGQGSILLPQTTGSAFKGPVIPFRPTVAATVPPFPTTHKNGKIESWDVTATEKTNSDRFFDTLDPQRKGYIEGDVAVPFMLQSKLSEDILALVWDLADINNDGRLTKDGFAVAMHLIQGKLAGKEVPVTLPPSLVPPSMRANGASPFAPSQSQEPQRDLLWDDTPPPSATSPQPSNVQVQMTGSQQSPFAIPTASQPQAPPVDPFGTAFTSTHKDLLGDDEDAGTTSPPLHGRSAEIGNTQNQLSSTNRSLETTKTERASVEQNLANQAAQLSALQTQLSSAKAAYEIETKLLATLRERYNSQNSEIQKTREELIRAESDLSAMRVEKAEIEGSFLRDKEEVRDLQRKMTEAGTQAEMLKVDIEKAKKDAKQQRGLLAIAKKQLSTKEAERVKAEKELEEAKSEVQEATKEREEADTELAKLESAVEQQTLERVKSSGSDSVAFAASHALPITPDASSPAPSVTGRSNNPFDRLTMPPSASSTPRSQSPFLPFITTDTPSRSSAVGITDTPKVSEDDPFGFSQAFQEPERPAQTSQVAEEPVGAEEAEVGTPRPVIADTVAVATTTGEGISPTKSDHDFFSTPPTTTTSLSPSPEVHSPKQTQFPSLEAAASQFPPVDSQSLDHPPSLDQGGTDLDAQLKELDQDESDSDSDEEPLADRRKSLVAKEKGQEPNSSQAPSPSPHDVFESFASPPQTTESVPKISSVAPFSQPPGIDTRDAFGAATHESLSPFKTEIGTSPRSEPPTVAGVNAFDEAMKNIPSGAPMLPTPQFTFDSAFEDNFDFDSASEPTATVPPAPAPAASVNGSGAPFVQSKNQDGSFASVFTPKTTNGSSAVPTAPDVQQSFSFDDAFSSVPNPASTAPPTSSEPSTAPTQPSSILGHISFDEAFTGFEPRAHKLENTFSSVSTRASVAPQPTSPDNVSFPSASTPVSPRNGSSSQYGPNRSTSPPPRATSPPPRLSSPRPRPSMSSTKDTAGDKKETSRHSKLSIRLPFGKRKAKHEPPPPPQPSHLSSQYLSPVDEPDRSTSPAVSDDVDAVKQLCGMGFSRSQAVDALERHGYDVQKALNSLLGSH